VGILDEDVARVRAAASLVDIAGEKLALRRVGRRFVGLCPFHTEKSPSFSINAEEGLYYCFGCQAKGDVITFVRELEHLDFAEAVEWLAGRAGIQLRYDDASVSREKQQRSELVELVARAVAFYNDRLLSAPDAGTARGYLRSRGYDRDVVERFSIGWAPDDWDVLARSLKAPAERLQAAGLAFVNKRGRLQDVFRGRVVFPIYDVRGDPVAFGARKLAGDGPKYLNSQETALYSKSRTLYGLNWSKADITNAGEAIVCEGYTDVIGFALAGLPRAVATCGTALADGHIGTLKNFARRLVLAYDADAAGQAAAARFYEWERTFEIDLYVAALPAGADPADVARTDPDALRAAVASAQPFLAFRVGRVLDQADLGTVEGRARAAELAMAAIAEHPSALVRDQYLMEVASRCRLDPDVLRAGGIPARPPAREREHGPNLASRVRVTQDPEEVALLLAVHRRAEAMDQLHPTLFSGEDTAAAYGALCESSDLHAALATTSDPAVVEMLQRIAVEDDEGIDLEDVVTQLARRAGRRAIGDLRAEVEQAEDPAAYSEAIRWLVEIVELLDVDDSRVDAREQLVAWLTKRDEEQG
jgi:DNA primase